MMLMQFSLLHCKNVSQYASQQQLSQLFEQYGFYHCKFYWKPTNDPKREHPGWCRVDFSNAQTAEVAIARLHERAELKNRHLDLDYPYSSIGPRSMPRQSQPMRSSSGDYKPRL